MHLVYINVILEFIEKELEKHGDILGLTRYVKSDKREKDMILIETVRKLFKELWLANDTYYVCKNGAYGVRIDSCCGIEAKLYFKLSGNALSIAVMKVQIVLYNNGKKLSSRDANSEESQLYNSHLVRISDKMKENSDIRSLVKCFYEVLLKKGKAKALPNVVTSFYDIYQNGINHFPQYLALTKEERFAILNTVFLKTGGNANSHMLSKEVFMELGRNHLISKVYKYSKADSEIKKNIIYDLIEIKWRKHRISNDPNIFYDDDEIMWIAYRYKNGNNELRVSFLASELWNLLLNNGNTVYDEEENDI